MNIFETITKIMEDVPAISKDKRNTTQNFAYRGIDDVMNTFSPLFAKHHLFIVPQVLEQTREERQSSKGGNLIYSICRVRYLFYAEDGTFIEAIVVGEGMDSGDKATNKAMAIAMKYALFQVFCIPTAEMKDPDSETPPDNVSMFKTINEASIKALKQIISNKNLSNEYVLSILDNHNYKKLADIKYEDLMTIQKELSE